MKFVIYFVYFFAVPPTSVTLQGYSDGQRVEVTENQELELTCKAENSKPAAVIVWKQNNTPFAIGMHKLRHV